MSGAHGYARQPGPHSVTGFPGHTALGAAAGGGLGASGGAAGHGLQHAGGKVLSSVRSSPELPHGMFYRSMQPRHYDELLRTGRVPATHETFVSPSRECAQCYTGVTVELHVKAGTTSQLEQIGVRDKSTAMRLRYPEMLVSDKGSGAHNSLFKIERGNANIGLGRGVALDVFKDNLVHFGKVS